MRKTELLPDFSRRDDQLSELMDCPNSDQQMLEKTLAQFRYINFFFSRARSLLRKYVVKTMRRQPDKEYHLVELGAGSCETAAWLIDYTRKKNLKLRITACDHDPRVVKFARENYQSKQNQNKQNLTILQRDIMDIHDLEPIDFIYGNHLLHHLSDDCIVELLKYLTRFENATVLFNDLKRSPLMYYGYYLLTTVFFHHSFARHDGLVSIRKGFQYPELNDLKESDSVRQEPYLLKQMIPGRIVLVRLSQKFGMKQNF